MKKHIHNIFTIVTQDTFKKLKAEAGKDKKYSTVTKHVMDILTQHKANDQLTTDYTYKAAGSHKILIGLTESEYNKVMADFAASGQDNITLYIRNVINTHFSK